MQVQLRGENYKEWARAMKISIWARRKWGFIDGTLTQPEQGASDLEDWWTVQSMIVSWILNTIKPSLRSIVAYVDNARTLWEDIKKQFFTVNGPPQIQQLKSDLTTCKQEGMAMTAYYEKLKVLWDELVYSTSKFPNARMVDDRTSRVLIGAGERKDGLYWYRGGTQDSSLSCKNRESTSTLA
ncbi:uncharacterized protein [Arachis hypogaea]|uniref:uncharacterized protein n=1 Tax=Arachis hypogaea TaxID=3818 RepID=UPI003B214E03